MLIGLMGVATAGKDAFCTLLSAHIRSIQPDRVVNRVAFATALKAELDPLFKAFGGTAWETDPVKKAAIRPLLVSHGMSQRVLSGGMHWIRCVEPDVKAMLARGEIVIITDTRFENELAWVKSLGGRCVYIERIRPDGTPVPPVNSDEAANDAALRAGADVSISWPTTDIHGLWPFVERAAAQLGLVPPPEKP